MMTMIKALFPTFFKYRFWIGFASLVLCIPIAYGIGYWDGSVSKEQSIKIKTIEKIITVREKQNAVRNHRPDDKQLIDSLRGNKF